MGPSLTRPLRTRSSEGTLGNANDERGRSLANRPDGTTPKRVGQRFSPAVGLVSRRRATPPCRRIITGEKASGHRKFVAGAGERQALGKAANPGLGCYFLPETLMPKAGKGLMNSGRKRDLPYEALAEATDTDMNQGRGELNAALRSIKEQATGLDGPALADEIRQRAQLYRRIWPELTITAPALAKHWLRVWEEASRAPAATNQSGTFKDCELCGGDKFVLVRTRPQEVTAWMEQHGRLPSETEWHEEYAACPACNPTTDTSHWRYDGTRAQALDPARVRELISRA